MTKTATKQKAQDELLSAMGLAFQRVADDPSYSDAERDNMLSVMSDQMARVERLFGVEQYSFARGI